MLEKLTKYKMSHLDRKIREKELIRQSILDAAIKIANKEGWNSVTIRKIADDIEYTPPIVYEYFKGKEDLFQELIYMGFRMLQGGITETDYSDVAPKDFLMEIAINHWNFATEHSALYQLMFSLERPTPNEEMSAGFRVIKENFRRLISNEEELHVVMFSWMCLITGTISFALFGSFPKDNKMHQFIGDKFTFYKKIVKRFIDTL